MADRDINELRALRRHAQAAIAKAEAALKDLQKIDVAMGSAINNLLNKSQRRDDSTPIRDRSGALQRRICEVILARGGSLNGVWVGYAQIAPELPDVSDQDLLKSLRSAVERLIEVDGDTYRLLEGGVKLLANPEKL